MDVSYRAYVLNVNDNINMVIDQVKILVNEKNLRNVILARVSAFLTENFIESCFDLETLF